MQLYVMKKTFIVCYNLKNIVFNATLKFLKREPTLTMTKSVLSLLITPTTKF